MFAERIIEALKQSKHDKKDDIFLQVTMKKIREQKRLSSKEFLGVWDSIQKEGPKTTYQNPNSWRRNGDVY
jgi:hypothetical protein